MQNEKKLRLVLAAALAVGLGACGGGGGGTTGNASVTTPAASDGPAAANAAALMQAFEAYRRSLPPMEVIDPAKLQQSLQPIDDTAEPTPIS